MAKTQVQDFSEKSIDELNELIEEITALRDEKVAARVSELEDELRKLKGAPARASTAAKSSGTRAKSKPQFRAPNGFEWSGQGGIPKAFKEAGVTDRAGLEQYRI